MHTFIEKYDHKSKEKQGNIGRFEPWNYTKNVSMPFFDIISI